MIRNVRNEQRQRVQTIRFCGGKPILGIWKSECLNVAIRSENECNSGEKTSKRNVTIALRFQERYPDPLFSTITSDSASFFLVLVNFSF